MNNHEQVQGEETYVRTMGGSMLSVDDAIQQVERLYASVTGRQPPKPIDGLIPPEKDPAAYVESSMERLLQMLQGQGPAATQPPSWQPPLDLVEAENEIVLLCDLPGVDRAHLQVTMTGQMLKITGERTPPVSAASARRIERGFGRCARVVMLGANARLDEAIARLADGVLEIRVPKGAPTAAAQRNIAIG